MNQLLLEKIKIRLNAESKRWPYLNLVKAKLEEIKSEISEIKAENRNILKDDEEYETGDYSNKKNNDIYEDSPKRDTYEEVKYNLNVPDYRETQFFNNYKEVRKVFTVNNEKIIKEFIAEHKNLKEEKEYKSLEKLRKIPGLEHAKYVV